LPIIVYKEEARDGIAHPDNDSYPNYNEEDDV
jgi:hypothetical protein